MPTSSTISNSIGQTTPLNSINTDPISGNGTFLNTIQNNNFNSTLNSLSNNFFYFKTVNALNWNKYFPYQIMILEKNQSPSNFTPTSFVTSGGSSSVDYGYSVYRSCVLTLPIPPESLSVTTPFASTTQVTLNGIVEEHAGAPLRLITLSGSTGMVPGKENVLNANNSILSSVANSIFAGSVQAQAASQNLLQGSGLSSAPSITYDDSELASSDNNNSTRIGYVHFRLLEYLLEMYATLKNSNNDKAKNYRLAFAMWKDEALYLVTPMQFEKRRTAANPMEYTYDIRLKAWKRIPFLNQDTDPVSVQNSATNQFALQDILNRVDSARTILQQYADTIAAVRSDVQYTVFNPLRELMFFLKTSINSALTLNDLPINLLQKFQQVVISSWNSTVTNVNTSTGIQLDLHKISEILSQTNSIYNTQYNYTRTSTNATPGGLSSFASGNTVTNLFNNPDFYADLFRQIKLSDLKIPSSLAALVNSQTATIDQKTRSYFQGIQTNLQVAEDAYADVVGVSDPTYNLVLNRTPATQIRNATSTDFVLLHALSDIIGALQDLTAVQNPNPQNITPTAISYVAGLASQNGITFNIPTSKFLIPMPYGVTLERLASTYLGNPDRWIEIATLNNLREPYIDEVGFSVPLLTNPTSNQVVVGSTTNLTIGQTVWLTAQYLPNFKTSILNIQKITSSSGTMNIIYLDIYQNFPTPYNIAGYTGLTAFLPGTTNSQQLIYIPSDAPVSDDTEDLSSLPGVNDLDNLLQVGGIDLLLDQHNDLVITNTGDCVYSFGLQNIVQTVKIAVSTTRGSLIRHPNFGLPLYLGASTSEIDTQSILTATKDLFAGDPTFTGVTGVTVNKAGPLLQITATVGIQSTGNNVPVTVNIKTG